MPDSRPRIVDLNTQWRIFYHLTSDAVVILGVVKKKTQRTTKKALDAARERLRTYQQLTGGKNDGD